MNASSGLASASRGCAAYSSASAATSVAAAVRHSVGSSSVNRCHEKARRGVAPRPLTIVVGRRTESGALGSLSRSAFLTVATSRGVARVHGEAER